MPLPREPIQFMGPFTGLNTRDAPSDLGMGEAQVADNVVLVDGKVRPHPPLADYVKSTATALSVSGRVISMLQVHTGSLIHVAPSSWPSGLVVLAKSIDYDPATGPVPKYSIVTRSGVRDVDLPSTALLTEQRVTWVVANRMVYCLDGSQPGVKTDGSKSGWYPIGLGPPTFGTELTNDFVFTYTTVAPFYPDAGTYEYGVTWYDPVHGVESNPTFITGTLDGANTITIQKSMLNSPTRAHTRFRVYRRNVSAGTPSVLVHTGIATNGSNPTSAGYVDGLSASENGSLEAAGTIDAGPYVPSRNGLPPKATIGCWYKNRMLYNDSEDGSRVWFSEDGVADHVADDNYLVIGGDPEDRITGMVELDGVVVVLKLHSIHIISGAIAYHTNATIAKGEIPFIVLPERFQSRGMLGCHNRFGGNGAIVCGEPSGVHYTHSSGLTRFDGSQCTPLGDKIRETWQDACISQITPYPGHMAQFAVDTDWGNLYILLTTGVATERPDSVLIYNWRTGGWSHFKPNDQNGINCNPADARWISCIATASAIPEARDVSGEEQDHPGPPSAFLLAIYNNYDDVDVSKIFFCTTMDDSLHMPLWKWRTGELPIGAGSNALCHYLTWIHGNRNSAVAGAQYAKASVSVDNKADQVLTKGGASSLSLDGLSQVLDVGRTGKTLELQFEATSTTSGVYKRKYARGVSGYSLDVEIADVR